MLTFSLVLGMAVAQPLVAWPVDGGFVVTNRVPQVRARLGAVDGVVPTDLAVSADGEMYVAVLPPTSNHRSRLVLVAARSPERIGAVLAEGSFFAMPTFSEDQRWVVFAHRPEGGGPPGSHQPGSFAQLYRVSVRSPGKIEQLTQADGCHGASVTTDGETIFMVHANCNGSSRVEQLRSRRDDGTWLPFTGDAEWSGRVAELDAWPVGSNGAIQKLLITRFAANGRELLVAELPRRKLSKFAFVLPATEFLRPRWNATGDAVLVQRRGELWLVTKTNESLVLDLEKE